jgi:hypothetical protein
MGKSKAPIAGAASASKSSVKKSTQMLSVEQTILLAMDDFVRSNRFNLDTTLFSKTWQLTKKCYLTMETHAQNGGETMVVFKLNGSNQDLETKMKVLEYLDAHSARFLERLTEETLYQQANSVECHLNALHEPEVFRNIHRIVATHPNGDIGVLYGNHYMRVQCRIEAEPQRPPESYLVKDVRPNSAPYDIKLKVNSLIAPHLVCYQLEGYFKGDEDGRLISDCTSYYFTNAYGVPTLDVLFTVLVDREIAEEFEEPLM